MLIDMNNAFPQAELPKWYDDGGHRHSHTHVGRAKLHILWNAK